MDKIFLTGDYRDASCQEGSDEAAKDIADYIFEIAGCVGVNNSENILLIPGNHDLQRNYLNRQATIAKVKNEYDPSVGKFCDLDVLVDSFDFYRKVSEQIKGKDYTDNLFENIFKVNPHPFEILEDVSILLLNSEMLAGEVIEVNGKERVLDDGQLCIGTRYVMNSLSLLKTTKKPVIALAHRGLDLLNSAERKKLLHIFKDCNVCAYLCGHSHDLWCDESFNIPQITVGCIKQQNGVKAGFSIGEYDEFGKRIIITAYSWENDIWKEYNHFDSQGYQKVWYLDEKFSCGENEFINEIKIVIDGVVREFQCKVLQMEHSVNHGSIMSTIEGSLKAQIKNNDYSKEIKFGDKFILSQNVWKVIGVDNTAKSTVTITCEKELINRSKDDMGKGIANFDEIR
ncbi:MAG: metallophosphoesterase [Lachnospira sp.]